jgi:hypothetical protein
MSATHPDGTYTVAIEEASLSAARTTRMAKEAQTENAILRRRIDEVERLMAQIQVRLDALEALADVMIIDTPIPFEPAQFAEAA